jgi:cytoskeletal protein CcmA (bactofilin family)
MVFNRQSQPSKEPPPAATDKVETVIGQNVVVKGTFVSQGSLRIDGIIEGAIEAKGNVIVGEGARVVADIIAHHVSVAGQVKGNVTASGRLEITAKGRVWGDIIAASLAVDEGGVLSGRSQLKDAALPPDLSEGIASARKAAAEK